MNHRLLLSSTALVSAGVLFANATPAHAEIEVTLSGYTEFGAKAATEDTLQDERRPRLHLLHGQRGPYRGDRHADAGWTYGSYAQIELGSGDENNQDVFVDEVNLFFSNGFGRIELGRQDGAEDEMFLGGEDAQSGTGGVDGDTANLGTIINVQNTDDATKATYYTPRLGGFQLGASYVPDSGDDGGRDGPGFDEAFKNVVGAGVNWVGEFGAVALTLSAVGVYGQSEEPGAPLDDDDVKDYSVGGLVEAGDLSFGATWGQLTDANEGNWAILGVRYAFGEASASIGYSWVDDDALDDEQHILVVSGDLGLAPGLALMADVSYNSDDPGADDGAGGQDDTLSGVLSIQVDY